MNHRDVDGKKKPEWWNGFSRRVGGRPQQEPLARTKQNVILKGDDMKVKMLMCP